MKGSKLRSPDSEARQGFKRGFRRARIQAGYKTQQDFADAFGTTIDNVKNWEQANRAIPEIDTIVDICAFLDCSLDYIFDRIDCRTHDLKFVHDFTGLDEDVIDKLHYRQKNHYKGFIVLLNYLLRNGTILSDLGEYYSSNFWKKDIESQYNRLFEYQKRPPRGKGELFGNLMNDLPLDNERFYDSCNKNPQLRELMGCTYVKNELEGYVINQMPDRLYKKFHNKPVHEKIRMDEDDKAIFDFLTILGDIEFLGGVIDLAELENRINSDLAEAELEWAAEDDYDLEDNGLPF